MTLAIVPAQAPVLRPTRSHRVTPETLLISAVLSLQDPSAAKDYGVTPVHLLGYRDEYQWILSYAQQYGSCPSVAVFKSIFRDFPISEDQSDVAWPAAEIRRQHAARTLSRAIMSATQALTQGRVEEAYSAFQGVTLETTSTRPSSLLVDPGYMDDYLSTSETRIPMPWSSLQGCTNGMGPGELWYIAARQGQGKSQQLATIAVEAALEGKRVLVFSLEMTKRQYQVRAHSIIGYKLGYKLSSTKMLRREFDQLEYKRLLDDIANRVPGVIDIHEAANGSVTPSMIAGRCADYDLTIVDHVGLVRTDEGKRAVDDWKHVANISNTLKETVIAKETRIMAAAQINREGETNGIRPPKLRTLALADALGQDADVVVTSKRYGEGATVYSVEKNRHGMSGQLFFSRFDPERGDFAEISRESADQILDDSED